MQRHHHIPTRPIVRSPERPHQRVTTGLKSLDNPFISTPESAAAGGLRFRSAGAKPTKPPLPSLESSPGHKCFRPNDTLPKRMRWEEPPSAMDADTTDLERRTSTESHIIQLQTRLTALDLEAKEMQKEAQRLEHLKHVFTHELNHAGSAGIVSFRISSRHPRSNDTASVSLQDRNRMQNPYTPVYPHSEDESGSGTDTHRVQNTSTYLQNPTSLERFGDNHGDTMDPPTHINSAVHPRAKTAHKPGEAPATHGELIATELHSKLAILTKNSKETGGGANPHPKPLLPHLMHRKITDPSKIIKMTEAPAAPQRIPHAAEREANRTSPTPRRHTTQQYDFISSGEGDYSGRPGGELIKPPPLVDAEDLPVAAKVSVPPHPPTRAPIVQRPKIGAGSVPREYEVHITPTTGIEITTAKYALPEGHTQPWVRNTTRPAKIVDPPQAFFLRTQVPVSYKDSALNPREKSDAWNRRLVDIEKMTGLSGRYPGERDYNRRAHGRHLPHMSGHYESQRNSVRKGSFYGIGQNHVAAGRSLIAAGRNQLIGHHQPAVVRSDQHYGFQKSEKPFLPNPASPRPKTPVAMPEEGFSGGAVNSPPPNSDLITERRTVFLEKVPLSVTIPHIIRALRDTGRLEEIGIEQNYQGQFAVIKFACEATAAAFSEREFLEIPISDGWSARLCITYAESNQIPKSQFVPINESSTRVVHIGPCPADYFVSAYFEFVEDTVLKSGLIDYIWEVVAGFCVTWPEHFLDVSLETRGNVIKAILSFSSIKAAEEVVVGVKTLNSFEHVKAKCGPDPCQGVTERRYLEIREAHDDFDADIQQVTIQRESSGKSKQECLRVEQEQTKSPQSDDSTFLWSIDESDEQIEPCYENVAKLIGKHSLIEGPDED